MKTLSNELIMYYATHAFNSRITPEEAYRIVKHTLMRFDPNPEGVISIYYDHYEDAFEFMPQFSTIGLESG